MNYSRQDVRIHTKITDEALISQMAKPIIEFADAHDVYYYPNLG